MKRYFFVAALCLLAVFPSVGSAFDVVDASVKHLGADAYLYQLTYEYGYLNATATMPMLVGARTVDTPQIVLERSPLAPGSEAAAIVLSEDATQVGQYYQVAPGERAEFTLIMLYRHGNSRIALPTVAVTDLTHRVTTESGDKLIGLTAEQQVEYSITP